MISVIVPVYNAEKYIKKCVDSILSQTVSDIEIILVDDGSTDNSPIICDEYARNNEKVKVIHKTNGGAGSARNAGLDVACGEYILFVDGDDYIHPKFIELLLAVLNHYHCKIASCHYRFVKPDETVTFKSYDNSIIESAERIDCADWLSNFDLHCNKVSLISPCMRLCCRSIFDDLRFKEGYTEEDSMILPYILEQTETIYKLKIPLYFWTENPLSVTRMDFNAKRFSYIMVSYERVCFFHSRNNKRLEKHFQKEFMNRCVEFYIKAQAENDKKTISAYKPYRTLYNKHWIYYCFNSGFCNMELLLHFLFFFHIPLYKNVYQVLNRENK